MKFNGRLMRFSDIGREDVISTSFCDFEVEGEDIEIFVDNSTTNKNIKTKMTELKANLIRNRDVFLFCKVDFEFDNKFFSLEFLYDKSTDKELALFSSHQEQFSKNYLDKNLVKLTYGKMIVFFMMVLSFPFYAMLQNNEILDTLLFNLIIVLAISLFISFNFYHLNEIEKKAENLIDLINQTESFQERGIEVVFDFVESFSNEIWEKINYLLAVVIGIYSISVFFIALVNTQLIPIIIIGLMSSSNLILIYLSRVLSS